LHKGRDGRLAHEFRPIGERRLLCRAHRENRPIYRYFWNRTISPSIICIDHHAGAAAAATSVGAEVSLCWEHISRTAMQRTGQLKLHDKNYKVIAEDHIRILSLCKSTLQFEALLDYTLVEWESKEKLN